MTDERKSKCRKIIHTAAAVSGLVGLGFMMFTEIDGWVVGVIRVVMIGCIGAEFKRDILSAAMDAISGWLVAWISCALFIGWPAKFIAERIAGFGGIILAIFASVIYVLEAALVTEGTGWALAHDLAVKERKQAEAQKDELPAESSGQ